MPRGGKREGAGRKPGPLSPAKLELAALAKGHAQEAINTILDLMRDEREPGSTRLGAAVALLDRGYGKPFQAIHHAGHDGGELATIDPTKLSAAAMRELLEAMDDAAPEPDKG